MQLSDHAHAADRAQLAQTLVWLSIAAGMAVGAYVVGGVIFASALLLLMAGIALIGLVLFLGALWFVRRGRVRPAAYLVSGTLAMWTLVGAPLVPNLAPAMALIPTLVMALIFPYLDRKMLFALSGAALLLAIALMALSQYLAFAAPLPAPLARLLTMFFVPAVTAVILLLFWQSYARLSAALQQSRHANSSLHELQASLERQVAARTSELQRALVDLEAHAAEQARMRAALEQQREAIRELSVPVLPVTDQTLVMPLIGALDTRRLLDLQQRALASLERSGARRLILDITGLPVVDSQVARGLLGVVQAARLLGAEVALVGIRPEVAQTIVGLGLDLSGVHTRGTLREALERAPARG